MDCDCNKRLDYFRSEMQGKMDALRKEFEAKERAITQRMDSLEKENQRLTREVRHAEMASR